jgi:hypothetical protein
MKDKTLPEKKKNTVLIEKCNKAAYKNWNHNLCLITNSEKR